jgi:hypothetical protein
MTLGERCCALILPRPPDTGSGNAFAAVLMKTGPELITFSHASQVVPSADTVQSAVPAVESASPSLEQQVGARLLLMLHCRMHANTHHSWQTVADITAATYARVVGRPSYRHAHRSRDQKDS